MIRNNPLVLTVLFAAASLSAQAAPIGNRLLSMVPAGAQIVTGIHIPLAGVTVSPTNYVTRNNNVDFDDWASLAAADPHAIGEQAVEVAATSPRGELKERLLLVDGSFNSARILDAALKHSLGAVEFAGVRVLVIQPLKSNDPTGVGMRWLAFPDNRTAVFGTPLLVQRALERRQHRAPVEHTLTAHLQTLHVGNRDWGILAMPADLIRRNFKNAVRIPALLQAMNGSSDLVLGVGGEQSSEIVLLEHSDPSVRAQLASR